MFSIELVQNVKTSLKERDGKKFDITSIVMADASRSSSAEWLTPDVPSAQRQITKSICEVVLGQDGLTSEEIDLGYANYIEVYVPMVSADITDYTTAYNLCCVEVVGDVIGTETTDVVLAMGSSDSDYLTIPADVLSEKLWMKVCVRLVFEDPADARMFEASATARWPRHVVWTT